MLVNSVSRLAGLVVLVQMTVGNLTKVARESLVLENLGEESLPTAYFASSIILLLLVLNYMRVQGKARVAVILRRLILVEAVAISAVAIWASREKEGLIFLFGISEAAHLLILLHFWYLVNLLFDAKESRKEIPRLTMIGLLGIFFSPLLYQLLLRVTGDTFSVFYFSSGLLVIVYIILLISDRIFYSVAEAPVALLFKERIERMRTSPLIRRYAVLIFPIWLFLYLYDFQTLTSINRGLPEGENAENYLLLVSSVGAFVGMLALGFLVPKLLSKTNFTRLLYLHPGFLFIGYAGIVAYGIIGDQPSLWVGLFGRFMDDLSYFLVMDSMIHLLFLAFPAEQKSDARALLQGLLEPLFITVAAGVVLAVSSLPNLVIVVITLIILACWAYYLKQVLQSYRDTLKGSLVGEGGLQSFTKVIELPKMNWQQVWRSKNWKRLNQYCLITNISFPSKVFKQLNSSEKETLMQSWKSKPVKNAKRLIRDLCYKNDNEADMLTSYVWLLGVQKKTPVPEKSAFLLELDQQIKRSADFPAEFFLRYAREGIAPFCQAILDLSASRKNGPNFLDLVLDNSIHAEVRQVIIPELHSIPINKRDMCKLIRLMHNTYLERQLRNLFRRLEGQNGDRFLEVVANEPLEDYLIAKCIYPVLKQNFPESCAAIRRVIKSDSIFIRVDFLRELTILKKSEKELFLAIVMDMQFELNLLWLASQLALKLLPVMPAEQRQSSRIKMRRLQLQFRKLYREQGFLSLALLNDWENVSELSNIIRFGANRPFELLNEYLATGNEDMKSISSAFNIPSPEYQTEKAPTFLELSNDSWARLIFLHEMQNEEDDYQIEPDKWYFYFKNYSGASVMEMKEKVISEMEILSYLMEVPMFSSMDLDDLNMLKQICVLKDWDANRIIFKEGDEGDSLIIILKGEVDVLKNSPNGFISLAKLGHGEVVGDMALLDGEYRSATVKTLEKCTTLRISRADFDFLLGVRPSLNKSVMKTLTSRLRDLQEKVIAGDS
jgi:hypothetical protein